MLRSPNLHLKILLVLILQHSCLVEAKALLDFSNIAKKSLAGVVNIRTRVLVPGGARRDLYDFFLNGRTPKSHSASALGSGVIFSVDGKIITNYHVVEGASEIEVLLHNEKKPYSASILGVDRRTDLALLKIVPHSKLKPLDMGDSAKVEIAEPVLAIGNPFGYGHTVTSGIISAKGRVIGHGPYDNFLQTDAVIHPGNSGGPLLDLRGRVVGINTAVSEKGIGIGFAIPMNLVEKVVYDLEKFGKVKRPWLGIVGRSTANTDILGPSLGEAGLYGVSITNLVIDAPAHQAGLQIGDLVTEVQGKKIGGVHDLQKIVVESSSGALLSLKVFRRKRGFQNVKVRLEEAPKNQDIPADQDLF